MGHKGCLGRLVLQTQVSSILSEIKSNSPLPVTGQGEGIPSQR